MTAARLTKPKLGQKLKVKGRACEMLVTTTAKRLGALLNRFSNVVGVHGTAVTYGATEAIHRHLHLHSAFNFKTFSFKVMFVTQNLLVAKQANNV